ncbi:alpha/beta-hydrolase [Irpex rosettiformis]|uniref:Alpha/beta-hydrolase n=1 Tax=Irpex rosettiformis TaxID=378272 RepID=A0ACB8UF48_9APHY|nr:alpha/beta-hydrolase [Irpex rosettiformis]
MIPMSGHLIPLFLAAYILMCSPLINASLKLRSRVHWQAQQAQAMRNFASRASATSISRAVRSNNITFSNPRASDFFVDGKSIPEMNFDIGPSYAGLLPINNATDETRQLFFWFFPPGPLGSADDLIFWTNGGPGCSSLEGTLQENGPFSWSWGRAKPSINEFSWTNLSSVLYVEQPVGTGFSQGVPNIKNEEDLAVQVIGFMQQFLEVFSELKEKNLYLTGESYAGMYVPYIANHIYSHPGELALNLKGIWVNDGSIGEDSVLMDMPTVNFVNKYKSVFNLNSSFMAHLNSRGAACGYTDYSAQHVKYPPSKRILPLPGNAIEAVEGCDLQSQIFAAALEVNPAFDIYRIFDQYPVAFDPLGFPGSFAEVEISPVYFDREDVKKAIHAPLNVTWTECSENSVFAGPDGQDQSAPSYTVLPNVIEKSERTVLVHGLADFLIMAEGTRAVIQNITWNGKQGFQTPIQDESFIVPGMGVMGNMHFERGLAYYEVALSGHMVAQFSPKAAFHIMEYLLGFRENP